MLPIPDTGPGTWKAWKGGCGEELSHRSWCLSCQGPGMCTPTHKVLICLPSEPDLSWTTTLSSFKSAFFLWVPITSPLWQETSLLGQNPGLLLFPVTWFLWGLCKWHQRAVQWPFVSEGGADPSLPSPHPTPACPVSTLSDQLSCLHFLTSQHRPSDRSFLENITPVQKYFSHLPPCYLRGKS